MLHLKPRVVISDMYIYYNGYCTLLNRLRSKRKLSIFRGGHLRTGWPWEPVVSPLECSVTMRAMNRELGGFVVQLSARSSIFLKLESF